MMRIVIAMIVLLTGLSGVAVYDANKTFGSSWAVRLFFHFYEDDLTRFATTFEEDDKIEIVALTNEGRFFATFTNPSEFDTQIQKEAEKKYGPLLRSMSRNPFLIACNGWYKITQGEGSFCIGMRSYIPIFNGAKQLIYHLRYWPSEISDGAECKKELVDKQFATCEVILSDNWTIHYEWWSELMYEKI